MDSCLRGKCALLQEIFDTDCLLQERSCGQNMIFITAHKLSVQNDSNYFHCIVKCVCISGHYEKNGQCIKKSDISVDAYNPVSNFNFISFFYFLFFNSNKYIVRI